MAIKKTELYGTILESCNKLRGGMDASQYKDYVLVVLFMKYVSDKAKADTDSLIELPKGCTFDDLVAAKNKSNVGEVFNKILEAVAEANPDLRNVITNADFCDEQKLGKGKDLVETVSGLIGVFQNPNLNFSKNREDDDDIIGDAYEYLMKNFASQSGKSKGQFYTPAEVSRLIAKVVGIGKDERPQISIYDPTCGSGSLLLRAKAEAKHGVSVNGQESDLSTIGMAKMNMIIHGEQTADLRHGDTLNSPLHYDILDRTLQQFDYVVANPPFSKKSWLKSAGTEDKYGRWGDDVGIGVPPKKCGDYAFLLHIIKSLKHNGRGACILPHGVLFRGNTEATIREYIVKHHYIKGIIGLPSNLFYGTGIPACIIVLDKKLAVDSKGIFMINANEGYVKDGAKNRLREQDLKRIVDTWEAGRDVPHYARFVTYDEIVNNDYNLNIPRYIVAKDKEIVQDIEAHLHGGIPERDIHQMQTVWKACPSLQNNLFALEREGYYRLVVNADNIIKTIASETSFLHQLGEFEQAINQWCAETIKVLKSLTTGFRPKQLIVNISQPLLSAVNASPCLVNGYDAYDQLMNYWAEVMQDDCYIIADKGWKPELSLPLDKKGAVKKSYTYEDLQCDLLPVRVVIEQCFCNRYDNIRMLVASLEDEETELANFVDENEDVFSDFDKVNASTVKKALNDCSDFEQKSILLKYLDSDSKIAKVKSLLRTEKQKLTKDIVTAYATFKEDDVKHFVVDCKWMLAIKSRLRDEMSAVTLHIADNVRTLRARYAQTLGESTKAVAELESQVLASLKEMGFNL